MADDSWTTLELLTVDGAPVDTDRFAMQKVGEEGLDWKVQTRGSLRGGLAPASCSFVVFGADATLTGEKVLGADVIMLGTLASRPAFGTAGRLYYVTDSGSEGWTRDSGAAWVAVPPNWAVIVGKPTTFAPTAHGSSAHTGNILPGGANQDLGAAYLDIAQEAAPANPGAGVRRVFVDTATGKLSVRTSAGSTLSLEEGAGGSYAPVGATYIVTASDATLTSELVLGTSIVMAGTLAARPAAGTAGRLYYVTDTGAQRWTRDNGSTWDDTGINWAQIIGAPALAPVAGTYVTMAAEAGLSAETVLGTGVVMKGTLAARPAAATAGRLYYVTDASSARWTRDTGSAWEDCPPDWSQVLNKPSTFAPSAHGSAAHTGNVLPGTAQDLGTTYLDAEELAAPANPAAGTRRIYVDSTTHKLSVRTSAGASVSLEEQGTGEANTASNVGTAGVGVFDNKSGVDLRLRKVNAASAKVTVVLNGQQIDVDATDASTSQKGAVQLSADGGTTAATVVQATDARLSDARTPTSHAHNASDVNAGTLDAARLPAATTAAQGAVMLATPSADVTAGHVVQANDARLSDARTPTPHTHPASDIASGTVATARLGSGTANGTTYLRGDQTWAAVTAGVGGDTGGQDNRLLRSDGTGGATLQASTVTVDDSGNMTLGSGGAGYVVGRRRWLVPGEDFDVAAGFSGSGLTNDGMGTSIFFSLPDTAVGLEYVFSVEVAHDLVIVAAGTDVIYLGASASSAGGTLTSSAIGSTVLLSCSKSGRWKAIPSGTWAVA